MELIKARLDDAKQRLFGEGWESRVLSHQYRDGTIDGEIVLVVPRGTSGRDVSTFLEAAFQTIPFGLGNEFWFSLGAALSFDKEEEEERSGTARVRGMDTLDMYYRRVSTSNLIDSFLRQQKIMIPGAEKRYRRKVEQVRLRLHWNPTNTKPER